MIQRDLIKTIKKDLKKVPSVVLFGPRQTGKTTLVKQLMSESKNKYMYLDMESPADKARLTDPELFLSRLTDKPVILDEVQTMPHLFPVLRSMIDRNRKPGRFLLLGSASPELIQQSAESLAGRVRYRELFPFSLKEIGYASQEKLWFRGGFPRAYLAKNNAEATEWLNDFIHSYVSRDLRMLGLPMQPTEITRLLQMLAHQHGQLLNHSNLARSLGISMPSVKKAMYYLEEAMLIRTLQPWFINVGKRLVKSPKVFIRDSGMLHNLLFVQSYEQLMGHPQAGHSWEGFVLQQILTILPENIHPWFYRSQDNAEIDLILTKGNRAQCAIEIKLTNAPEIRRGNTEAIADLNPKHCIVITPEAETYPLKDKWWVYGVENFLKELHSFL
ncbi:MAG: ATP-binding protein [Chitinophagaceae bacterium]|nr:ATP-binding protein [Chitinophagaceae bacterium]